MGLIRCTTLLLLQHLHGREGGKEHLGELYSLGLNAVAIEGQQMEPRTCLQQCIGLHMVQNLLEIVEILV